MARPVVIPRLGLAAEDALLLEWLVEDGAEVRAGQPLLVVEAEKAATEVEAEADGFLRRLVPAGHRVPFGAHVADLAATRQEYDALRRSATLFAADVPEVPAALREAHHRLAEWAAQPPRGGPFGR